MAETNHLLYKLLAGCLVLLSDPAFAQSAPKNPLGAFACGRPVTLVSAVQGPGASSPMAGTEVDIEAVVIGAFQQPGELGGLFVQEEDHDQDQDAHTSEGLFAFTRFPARVGDLVRVRGTVTEFKGLTELHPVTRLKVCAQAAVLPAPAIAQLPPASADEFEAIENMRVSLPQSLLITDVHPLWEFGELVVSSERLFQPTQLVAPGEAATKLALSNRRDQLIIDDGRSGRNLPISLSGQDNLTSFSTNNPVRSGQVIVGVHGIMHFGFGDYRLQPVRPIRIDRAANPRAAAPNPVGGTLRAGVFNVLNYFSTLNISGPVCGPSGNLSCRGARNRPEQQRQMQKLAAALSAIDADILALVELENNSAQSLQDIVIALNSVAGMEVWTYVPSGSIGQDAIKVGLLFKPAAVAAEGRFAILNRAVDSRFNDALNRPALAQTFRTRDNGSLLTVVVTHLKSKSCLDATGPDNDQEDGQACFNRARTEAAAALADWAVSDPTGTGGAQVLVLGDFNSYRMEDPLRVMQGKRLVDLLSLYDSSNAYTYVYDGLAGTLDYAFASPDLAMRVTGVTVWHINADESAVLDYHSEPGEPMAYHAGSPFRSSDHDPVIIGLDMGPVHATIGKPQPAEDSSTLRYTLLAGVFLLLALGAHGLRKK